MKRSIIYLLTAIFLAAAGVCGWYSAAWHGGISITARIPSQEGWEEIPCWEGEEDHFYLFLPSYGDMSRVQLYTNVGNTVFLNDKKITDGMTCEDIPLNMDLELVYMSKGKRHEYTLQLLSAENTGTMYLETASGTMDYIHEEKGNKETGQMRLYSETGAVQYSGTVESVKGRGNDSWGKKKKPYSLTLSAEADLLRMGTAKKWVLLANYNDPTHLRNKLVYDLAQEIGLNYSPDCQWVDLYLNGEYAGLYLLSERNEVHPQRVAVEESRSFLVNMDPVGRLMGEGHPYVTTSSNMAFRIRSSAFPEDVMQNILQTVDNAIHADDGIDPVTGKHWRELIDLDSWARKYLIEEIFGNLDASAASQFYYYVGDGENGTLYAGPVWDYDLSMGSHKVWQTTATDSLYAGAPHIWSEEDHPWMPAMLRQPEFRESVLSLYREEFLPRLEVLLESGIDAYARTISAAAKRNQLFWASEDFDEHVQLVKGYLAQRLQFLNSYWLEEEVYHLVTINIRTGSNIGCYAVRDGECLSQFPETRAVSEAENYSWLRVDTGEVFDITQPITEDVDLYLMLHPQPQPETEVSEVVWEEAVWEEPEEEPISLLRLGPALIFTGMLVLVCAVGLYQNRKEAKKEPVHN